MANTDAPFGLRPVRYYNGSPYQGQANTYFATGATGIIAPGDPVVLGGTTNASKIGEYPIGMLREVQLATAGDDNPILGVCVSVLPAQGTELNYRANSTDRIIMVADSPDLVFEVQADDDADTTNWAVTVSGLHANLASGTASTVYSRSVWELDGSDVPANDPSNQVYLLGLAKRSAEDNQVGPFAIWEVMINQHELTPGVISNAGRFEAK